MPVHPAPANRLVSCPIRAVVVPLLPLADPPDGLRGHRSGRPQLRPLHVCRISRGPLNDATLPNCSRLYRKLGLRLAAGHFFVQSADWTAPFGPTCRDPCLARVPRLRSVRPGVRRAGPQRASKSRYLGRQRAFFARVCLACCSNPSVCRAEVQVQAPLSPTLLQGTAAGPPSARGRPLVRH
jgi:hypothetical protein